MKDMSISYPELGAVLTAGVGISYLASFLIQRESMLQDVMTTAGTYLVSKAVYQLSTAAREGLLGQTTPSESNEPKTKVKKAY